MVVVIIGKNILFGIILKKYRLVRVILRLFTIIAKKPYRANSKGRGTTNLLNHVPNCVKNSNRDALKRQQTLAFEPKLNGEERFQLVPIAFIVESFRKSLK